MKKWIFVVLVVFLILGNGTIAAESKTLENAGAEATKYEEGRQIKYSIKELSIYGDVPTYNELNITNTHKVYTDDNFVETTKTEEVAKEISKTEKKKNIVCFIIIMLLFIAIMVMIIVKSDFLNG